MTDFTLSTLATTVAEVRTYSFSITPNAALSSAISVGLSSATKVRWEIVTNGKIPISSDDFSAFKGEVDFAASATLAQTISIIPTDDTLREVTKDFEVRIYQVVGADDSSSAETNDKLLGSQAVTLTDADTGSFGSHSHGSNGEGNIIPAGSSQDIFLNAAGGGDTYVITRYQFGNVEIDDTVGANLIKFDYGVSITGFAEVARISFGALTVSLATLTLSTGAEMEISFPAGASRFQLGDATVLETYAAFKTAIGASGTNAASALAVTYTVDSFTSVPDVSANVLPLSAGGGLGTTGDDVIGFGSDADVTPNGGGGNDVYVITRFQSGDVDINDSIGRNLVKFDYLVSITGFHEISIRGFFGHVVREVALTLSTGAEVSIHFPTHYFNYQLGDGTVISSYAAFKTAIGASGTNATSILAAPYAIKFDSVTTGTVTITPTETLESAPLAIGEVVTAVTSSLTDTDDSTLTFTYQWKLGGTDISGATDATYTTIAAGIYTVDVGATDSVNKVTTDFTSARVQVGSDIITASAYTELKIGAGGAADTLDASDASTLNGSIRTTSAQLIQGGALGDKITASAYGDVIVGGYGDDTITLGAGADTVVYRINGAGAYGVSTVDGGDTITKFEHGVDKWIFADTDGVSFTAATMATLLDGSVVGNGNVQLTLNDKFAVSGFQVHWSDGTILTVGYSTAQNPYTLLGITDGDFTAIGLALSRGDYKIIDPTKVINVFGGEAFIDFVDYSTPENTNLGFEIL